MNTNEKTSSRSSSRSTESICAPTQEALQSTTDEGTPATKKFNQASLSTTSGIESIIVIELNPSDRVVKGYNAIGGVYGKARDLQRASKKIDHPGSGASDLQYLPLPEVSHATIK
ncbi:hypothetical protein PS15m_011440 [Mucor circinelloides]